VDDRPDRLPDAAEIAAINAKHLIATPLKPADLLFVFGTRNDEALRAEAACRLWREGLFQRAIVSGGVTPGSDRSECAVIKPLMVQGGVPADRILEEHRATNTGENVLFSLPILEAAIGLKNIKSVICLGNTWTGPLCDDAASALARGREDAGYRRQFCDAAGAVAHRRRIQPPHAA
jgi:hypothetical protein